MSLWESDNSILPLSEERSAVVIAKLVNITVEWATHDPMVYGFNK